MSLLTSETLLGQVMTERQRDKEREQMRGMGKEGQMKGRDGFFFFFFTVN